MFHMGIPGMPFPVMPPPFMPVTGPPVVPPYPVNVAASGNGPAAWKDKGSRRHSGDRTHRQSPSQSCQFRGRGGKVRGERGTRLAIFLEYAKGSFQFVENDIRELFTYFGGISTVSVKSDIAAAEVTLPDGSAAAAAVRELNSLVIPGIGTLRCTELKRGETLNHLVSKTRLYEKSNNNKSHSNRKSYDDSRPSNSGHSENSGTRRLSRFELIDLFTFEPEFDVAAQILGVDNANIEYIMKNAEGKVDITITGKPLNSAPIAERLHVTLSSCDIVAYTNALDMIEELLSTVCENFVAYAQSLGKPVSSSVGFGRHEYKEINGVLEYNGVIEKQKTWLQKRNLNSNYKSKQHNSSPQYRKVNDRSRGINRNNTQSKSNARPVK